MRRSSGTLRAVPRPGAGAGEASGCRAIYIGGTTPAFSECWATDMTGPIQGGGCDGLDAYACSQHDDCVAIHAGGCTDTDGFADPSCPPGAFVECGDEPGTGPGNCHEEVDCTVQPPDCPTDTVPGVRDGCYTGFCIPLSECEPAPACAGLGESDCVDRADCDPLFRGSDCTCDATGCSCATLEYTGCEELTGP